VAEINRLTVRSKESERCRSSPTRTDHERSSTRKTHGFAAFSR
jgi:hypothetical protein